MPWPDWPTGAEPARCPVYVHNAVEIAAAPEATWRWLVRADLWPTWFPSCKNVRFERGGPELATGTKVAWHMLGADIRVEVVRCEPPRLLDWQGGASGVHAYHSWLLEPQGTGTRLVTDETERGPLPFLLRWYLRGALHRAHQQWIEGLAAVVGRGPPPAKD
jgi:uncharacterized protein YndB with AHSA1/START domain